MNIIIIEDEKPAVEKLKKALKKISPEINIIAELSSVYDSVKWLRANPAPDLILLDIQLTDGSSFEILKECNVTCPVIFITAFDDFLLDAFEYNSIDYLLKPVKPEKLEQAVKKYQSLKNHFTNNYIPLIREFTKTTSKQRVLVKKGIEFVSVKSEEIAYFYTEHKIVFLIDTTGNRYIVDKPLTIMESDMDKEHFFRVNRKYLVNINAIKKFKSFSKGKILLELNPPPNEEIIVSQENASSFKSWIDR